MKRMIENASDFRRTIFAIDSAVGFGSLAIMIVYLVAMLDLSAQEWRWFGGVLLVVSFVAGAAPEPLRRRVHAPILDYLRASQAERTDAVVEAAFRAAMVLPRTMLRVTALSWAGSALAACLLMTALGFESWLAGRNALAVFVSATTGGMLSIGFVYFATKRAFAPLCSSLAERIPDTDRRRSLVRPVRLARKLQLVVAGTGFASLIFTIGVAYEMSVQSHLDAALARSASTVGALAPLVEARGLDDAISAAFPVREFAPSDVRFELVDGASLARAIGREDLDVAERGVHSSSDGARLLAWTALADGRVLLASSDAAAARRHLAGFAPLLVAVLCTAVALSLAIAWLLAEDVRGTVTALREDAERLASGDLTSTTFAESEDELGELARSFARMTQAIRATVVRVAEAADRVESAASEVARTGEGVAEANAAQVLRVAEVSALMDSLRDEVRGVAASAHQLGESVEESSSSILELGAAGHELSETASSLSQRVDEVSSSIEQMVRSVKQVGATAQGLSDAASDTSSSMEEMASAMRSIDTTAAKTAGLSSEVVASSESGVAKVRQTIDGMHAIREATDAAERVIRALGDRTQEIGSILDVIVDVGDETTLLALNAAIIAAQAGEHGRAFSVVADEIKDLAERVLASTKEVASVVRAVQVEASNAVGAVDAGSASVAQGVDLAAEAGVSLEQIARAASESGRHIAQIVAAVREQTAAAAHVASLMERVNGGVEEIRSAGEEQDRGNEVVFRSATTMREIALHVRRTTEEQSRGFARIRETTEGVRGAVESIQTSLRQQSEACVQVAGFLEQVEERTRENDRSVRSMGDAMHGLARDAEALRAEVARFRI